MGSPLTSLIRRLLPSPLQLVGFPIGALLVLSGIFYEDLSRRFFSRTLLGQSLQGADYTSGLLRGIDTPVVHSTVIVVFWSLIGLLAYTVVWGLGNVMIEARNEVFIQTSYVNKGTIGARAGAMGRQLLWATILVIAFLATALVLVPLWTGLFGRLTMTDQLISQQLWSTAGAVLGASLNAYALWVLSLYCLGQS
jgi:magnesium-transporting ATPase (P-type)